MSGSDKEGGKILLAMLGILVAAMLMYLWWASSSSKLEPKSKVTTCPPGQEMIDNACR